jgi:hypothetical protein
MFGVYVITNYIEDFDNFSEFTFFYSTNIDYRFTLQWTLLGVTEPHSRRHTLFL